MITMTPDRVSFDDCEYADSQALLYQGMPYTGTVFETRPDGSLWTEQGYKNGILDGLSRGWYANGQLDSETLYRTGRRVYDREWHQNGKRKLDRQFDERSRIVAETHFDESGQPSANA
jgi:antitoxin component YwqK of YwqJK toxin-antitoxin module